MSFESLSAPRSDDSSLSKQASVNLDVFAAHDSAQGLKPQPLLKHDGSGLLPSIQIEQPRSSAGAGDDSGPADKYRWLEDSDSKKTKDWVSNKRDATEKYLSKLPDRDSLQKRIESAYDYEQRYDMWKQNGRYYLWKQDGLKEQPILCELDSFSATPKPIIDPNKFTDNSVESIYQVQMSNDGKYASLDLSAGGQDAALRKYFDIANQKFVDQVPGDTSWPEIEPFHKRADLESFTTRTQHGEKLQQGESDKKQAPWSAEGDGDPSPISIIMPDGSTRTYTVSTDGASMHKLLLQDSKTGKETTVLPEQANEKLEEVKVVGDKLVAHYMKDAASELKLFDLDGNYLQDISLPGRGTVRSLCGIAGDSELIYTYSGFNTPITVFHFDTDTLKGEAQFTPKPKFDPKEFVSEETFYKSKDGTPVHMFLVHKKGVELNGKNPTYLYGYGGFNVDITPFFGNGYVPFLQDGGILAVANLRGDGEFGEKWHEDGMLNKKQNVFDDFIGAAQYLVDNKYTDKGHLAIGGASNGGLLVGATVVERPDLFGAAIPEVGLFDMIRFPQLGPGKVWEPEYGDPSKTADYQNLLKYSPYQNLKPGTNLPPILTMTAANDDRVSPPHSYKFVAAAQDAQGNPANPIMLYVGQNRGHGHGMTTSEKIQEYRNKWSFLNKVLH